MSSPVILSRPAVPPDPITSDWSGLRQLWTGWDGSVWDLNSYEGGALLYRKGVVGLHFPQISRFTSASRAIPGHRLRGWRAEAREVQWPIYLWGDTSEGWLARQRAFFRTLHPDRPGTWSVTAGSETRTLELTGVFEDDHEYEIDPLQRGWAQYDVTLEAEQPFWRGEPIVAGPWEAPSVGDFFGAGGPPFFISSTESFGSATAVNPGDIEAWGVWKVEGPMSDVELGVGEAVIDVPFEVPAGSLLVIDTDPRRPTATLDGVDVTGPLGLQRYAPLPDGSEVPLHVEGSGSGSVRFEFTPLYFRAF